MRLSITRLILSLGVFFCLGVSASFAANPTLQWQTFETEHFLIHHPQNLNHLVDEVAAESERAHELLVPYMEWIPEKKTHVVMVDDYDSPNGSATPIPNNTMMLIMQPPISGSLTDYDSWLRLLIIHEYTHILHIDKALNWPNYLRDVFGRFLLLFPNALHPNWFQEGFATYIETDDEKGLGRGQSDTYQMMMRQEVLTGLKTLGKVNTVLSREWPGNHAYLYGVYYMRFIRDVYGEQVLKDMIDNYSDNLIPFRVDSNPETVTGKTLKELWPEFEQYLRNIFVRQAQNIQQYPITHTTRVLEDGYSYTSPRVDSQNTIWFAGHDGYNWAALYRHRQGQTERLLSLNSVGDMDISENDDIVISQLEFCDNRDIYFDLYKIPAAELYQDEPQMQRLTTCGRYHKVRWYQGDLIAIQYEGAQGKLVRLSSNGQLKSVLWEGQYGDIIGEFDINASGDLVAVIKKAMTSWNLYHTKIEDNIQNWKPITQDDGIQSAPYLKGNELYYVLSAQGQKEVQRVNLRLALQSKGKLKGKRLTNLLTGVEEVVPYGDRQLLLKEYTDQGYRISIAFTNEDLPNLEVPAAAKYPKAKEVKGESRKYSPWSSVAPTWWLPIAQSDGETSEIGFLTMGNDAPGFHVYSAQLTHESTFNYLLPNISYSYDGRYLLNYLTKLSSVDFFGINAETASFQRDISLAYMYHDLSVKRKFNPYIAYINSETKYITDEGDQLKISINGETKSSLRDDWAATGFIYSTLESDVFHGEYVRGGVFQFNVESASLASNDISDGEVFTLDGRYNLSFENHHALSQRFVVGIGNDEAPDFELGGVFGDPYILPTITLNKRDYALRGYEEGLAELKGDNMALYSAEYRLPFSWNEHSIMAPPIGTLGWATRAFVEVGSVWQEGESPEKGYSSVGAELILDDTIAYYLPIRLRLGVAQGLEEEGSSVGYIQFGSAF